MPAEVPSSHRWLARYKSEVVILGFFAAMAIGGPWFAGHLEYVGGTKNSHGDGFLVLMAVYGLLLLAGAGFTVHAIIQLILPPYTCRHILLRLAFVTAPALILVGGFIANFRIGAPSSPFLRGFERWVVREVDIDAIQQWLATEGRKYAGQSVRSRDELPDFLVRFKPAYIRFRDLPAGTGLCVEFEWGGPPGHWALIVGPPDMPMPEGDPPDLGPSEVEIRHPIRPGVYIRDRG